MKSILKQQNITQVFFYFLLILLLFSSYYPLLSTDPITDYDDQLLLGGVENLQSLTNYIERIFAGKVLDIQPMRDLSYFIDFKIKDLIPFHSFHLTNLVLWIGICYFFKNILEMVDENSEEHFCLIWSLVFLYAFSPVFSSSVAWVSGRKHLLSTFFTLWATFLFLKNKKYPLTITKSFSITLCYLLATLSQPINVLWPVFILIYSFIDQKIGERKILIGCLVVIALIILSVNLYYYGVIYERITAGDGKYDSSFGAGLSLLALGRYFYLTLFPFDSLPVSHYQGSWENMVGLVLLISGLFMVYKKRVGAAIVFCFIVYFFLPLIPVTYKITRIFCSDTYILNASIGIYVAVFLILKNKHSKKIATLFFIYAFTLFYLNLGYIKIFESTEAIFNYAYAKEATPMSITNVADNLLVHGKFAEAKTLIDQLEIMEPDNRYFVKLKSDLIYNDPKTSEADKSKALEALNPKAPIVYLRLALIYSNNNNVAAFETNIRKLLSDPQAYIRNSYLRNEEVVALIRVTCEKNKVEAECKKQYDDFSKSIQFTDWKPELYKAAYFELKKHPNSVSYK